MKNVYNKCDMEDIYSLSEQLKKTLDNDPRLIALNEAEEKMNNDKSVISLVIAKEKALNEYNDILSHFDRESETAHKYQKKLYEAKKALEEHPLVKDYLAKYQVVRMLYQQIEDILFSDLNTSLCPRK